MKKNINIIYRFIEKHYIKILKLPKVVRYLIGGLIILLGVINIINPFLNGIFMILAGIRIISEDSYKIIKNKLKNKKKVKKVFKSFDTFNEQIFDTLNKNR